MISYSIFSNISINQDLLEQSPPQIWYSPLGVHEMILGGTRINILKFLIVILNLKIHVLIDFIGYNGAELDKVGWFK